MNQIKPHQIWIGNAKDGGNFQEVFDKGIQAIIHLALEEPPVQPPRSLIYCRFPLVDGNGNDQYLLCLAIKSVVYLIKQQIPILVCCGGGMSRSPAIVAAALSLVEKTTLQDCLKHVSEFHATDLSPALWEQILQTIDHISPGL
jgi:protein-tyrosine phosphatase